MASSTETFMERMKDDEGFNDWLGEMGFTFEELTPTQLANMASLYEDADKQGDDETPTDPPAIDADEDDEEDEDDEDDDSLGMSASRRTGRAKNLKCSAGAPRLRKPRNRNDRR